ncbi:hypothetical protein [Pseudoalteromonas sp. PA2MD11]|uniref:hypothetical protein n=1 Tax=Pseudoalteromonas sp. PA2MD11 TaxID=2785057 RepID=UPI001AE0BB89|nr:hypothetical protein [Pseudoalteromonas sp. PA2MD11]
MESGLITFFDVTECGFYKKRKCSDSGKFESIHVQGSIKESVEQIIEWAANREFEQTVPWCTEEAPSRAKVFFKDYSIDSETGECLIILCKSIKNGSSRLHGFDGSTKIGDGKKDVFPIDNKRKGKELIVADIMYYWFLPEENLLASIKFPHSICSTDDVTYFFKKCIDNFIPNKGRCVKNTTIYNHFSKRDIAVKRVTYEAPDKASMSYSFNAEMKEIELKNTQNLGKLCKQITHIVIRDTISAKKAIETESLSELWRTFRNKSNDLTRNKHVEIIEEVFLTADSLKQLINTYSDDLQPNSIWNNIGFKIGANNSTKWFDSYLARKYILLDPKDKKEGSYYPAESIMKILKKQKADLLDFYVNESSAVNY